MGEQSRDEGPAARIRCHHTTPPINPPPNVPRTTDGHLLRGGAGEPGGLIPVIWRACCCRGRGHVLIGAGRVGVAAPLGGLVHEVELHVAKGFYQAAAARHLSVSALIKRRDGATKSPAERPSVMRRSCAQPLAGRQAGRGRCWPLAKTKPGLFQQGHQAILRLFNIPRCFTVERQMVSADLGWPGAEPACRGVRARPEFPHARPPPHFWPLAAGEGFERSDRMHRHGHPSHFPDPKRLCRECMHACNLKIHSGLLGASGGTQILGDPLARGLGCFPEDPATGAHGAPQNLQAAPAAAVS